MSKYAADLLQLDNGVKVPPTGNKCTRCDLTENLWMNLTDGTILCGRKNFDGMSWGAWHGADRGHVRKLHAYMPTGTGGNGHAAEFYNETKYPLAVKLGTITADGADVYSYPEDDMVTV